MFLMSINAEEDSIRVVLSHHGEQGDSVPGQEVDTRLLFNYACILREGEESGN